MDPEERPKQPEESFFAELKKYGPAPLGCRFVCKGDHWTIALHGDYTAKDVGDDQPDSA